MRIVFPIFALMLSACAATSLPEGQVKTSQGIAQGTSSDDLTKFLGIEYARAERWKLPKDGLKWEGEKTFDAFGPACPQEGQEVMVEDCLYLNIFTPEGASEGDKLPVMVWFHGGGLRAGQGGDGPQNFARDGMIVVSFNYRLGELGFKDWLGWDENDPRNFGQADMVKALEWVNENISGFGGDAENVTLAGHSAGGMGVQLMMVDPRAKGLFQRAIAHAGYGAWPFPKAANPTPEMRQRIRYGALETQATPEDIVAKTPFFRLPYIQGSDLPNRPVDVFKSGGQAAVPYMAGANSFDGFGTLQGAGFKPESFLAPYKRNTLVHIAYDEDLAVSDTQTAARLFGDMRYVFSSWQTARYMRSVGKPGYLFYYDKPSDGAPGAYHGAQYEELFGQGEFPMKSYYLNFIKTGDPNGKDLPQWDYYGGKSLQWMIFDPEPKPARSPLTKRMQVIETLKYPDPTQ
ncbi:MAG: carboxylesterase family protein [Hellea sp.]